MRRALGLEGQATQPRAHAPRTQDTTPSGRHRHRFVADGEVPVVMVQSRPDQPANNRLDAAAAVLAEERAARERAERALAAANATIRDLQTKLAHATLAQDEAAAALHTAQQQLAAAVAPPVADDTAAAPRLVRRRGRPPKSAGAATPAKPRAPTQKPVKWWVKGWRANENG